MSDPQVQKKLDQLASTVPSLPTVVHELRKILYNINIPLSTIEQIINKDPSFCARLLKLANSSYFGFSFKVSTVSQALVMLGLSELRTLLLATAMTRIFKGINNPLVTMESFWKHSVACGICARQLGVRYGESNIEELFTAGLMHDLGRLVLLCNLPGKTDYASKLAAEQHISIVKAETQVLSFNHADLSAQILKTWKLPEFMYEVVGAHHNPLATTKYRKQAVFVHIADIIVDAMGIGSSGESVVTPCKDVNMEVFENNETSIAAVLDEVDYMTDELVRIFISEE